MGRQQQRKRIRSTLYKKYIKFINEKKKHIIREYGKDPTVTYYYYSCNPIEYAGEEQVRASLESICNQGEVFIGDYGSNDGIHDLAEEYGAIMINVKKTPGIYFHESKIANKLMHESENNFMGYLNFNVVYPRNFNAFFKRWLRNNNIRTHILKLMGDIYADTKGTISKNAPNCVSSAIYRPYILYARGYDERTIYHGGTSEYAIFLLMDFFRLIWDTRWVGMVHRYYTNEDKKQYLKERKGIVKQNKNVMDLIEELFNDFGDPPNMFENVQNSYW